MTLSTDELWASNLAATIDHATHPEHQLPTQALAEHYLREVQADFNEQQSRSTDWERRTCRACLGTRLRTVLSLGDQPPANAYLRTEQLHRVELKYPLEVRLCENCGMVQLGHVVPAELLFRSYLFFTSSSRRMADHFSKLMTTAANEFVPPGGLIVEIGSNDGTALSSIQRRDVRLLGIDPARNISVMAASRGVPTIAEFFTETLASEVSRVAGQAHLIVACNVLGHIDDLDDVCRAIKVLLAPEGAMVFEVPYLGELVAHLDYDTIYHEHLSYFAIRPLVALLNRHGLRLERIEPFPVHGGTIRCVARHGQGYSDSVAGWLQTEADLGLLDPIMWHVQARKISENREQLVEKLSELKAAGKTVIGYGAPAKGTVLLNYCGIGTDLLSVVLDSTPAKQGLHVPGTHQPILAPSELSRINPDVLLLLAWNHAPEILERERLFRSRGGQFLTPRLEML